MPTINSILREITNWYLSTIDKTNLPNASEIEEVLLEKIQQSVEAENMRRMPGTKLHVPKALDAQIVAEIIINIYDLVTVSEWDETNPKKWSFGRQPKRKIIPMSETELDNIVNKFHGNFQMTFPGAVKNQIRINAPHIKLSKKNR